jgi:predicted membrane channel-forming protein YqfA (hemolysin III family)
MSHPEDSTTIRVEADGAELEAPRNQAVTAVLEEGERVERTWTAADFGHDKDWDHPDTRPRMRGWLHLFAFFGAIIAGAVLIPLASVLGPRAGFSVAVYCLTICGLFGISALYHRRRWSPRGWKIMKRLDHSMIFLFIAGTYTPFSLLAVPLTPEHGFLRPDQARWLRRGVVGTIAALGVGMAALSLTLPSDDEPTTARTRPAASVPDEHTSVVPPVVRTLTVRNSAALPGRAADGTP